MQPISSRPSPPCLTSHPRFNGATAWLAAYTRTIPSSSSNGPPSAWSPKACTSVTCPGDGGPCDFPLCRGPAGICSEGTPQNKPAAAPCDDGDITTSGVCEANRTCTSTPKCQGVSCPGATQCTNASSCIPSTGQCSLIPLTGAPCDDGSDATVVDFCDGQGKCTGRTVSEELKAAVVKCVSEEPMGNCSCAGMSCSTDARFQGEIGTWDVSGVTNMLKLFYTYGSNKCTIYCDFNGDISEWDTSSVTRMDRM